HGQPEPHPDGYGRRSGPPALWTDLSSSGPAPHVSKTSVLSGRAPRRHHRARGGCLHGLRVLPITNATHKNHSGRHSSTSGSRGRLEKVMRIAPRSVWKQLSETVRQPIRKEVLIIEQEVLHDYVRAHSAVPSPASSHRLSPSVQPAAGSQSSRE